MTQKITLSIPDMLHERLTEWRSSFNFSKLFQDALTEAIEKKENFQNRLSNDMDMGEIIKRLRREKLTWGKKHFEIGKKEALGWARTAKYEALLYVTSFERYYDIIFDPQMIHYFKQAYQTAGLVPYPEAGPAEQLPDHDKKFIDGWFNGLHEFWDQVKDKI
ncbi:MAG: hypothetical protein MI862_22010 [Desulfobacterales bacterium]|nr:hypothetical protein [Desulfobacterales bacterium]